MKLTIEATPELYEANVNGRRIPFRVWQGVTDGGIHVEAFVYSVMPLSRSEQKLFRESLPPFMRRTRDLYDLKIETQTENDQPSAGSATP